MSNLNTIIWRPTRLMAALGVGYGLGYGLGLIGIPGLGWLVELVPSKLRDLVYQICRLFATQLLAYKTRESLSHCFPELSSCRRCCGFWSQADHELEEIQTGLEEGCGCCTIVAKAIEAYQERLGDYEFQHAPLDHVCFENNPDDDGCAEKLPWDRLGIGLMLHDGPGFPYTTVWIRICKENTKSNYDHDLIRTNTPETFQRNVPTRLDISRLTEYIQKWTLDCDKAHPRCADTGPPFLPTRVIDISCKNTGNIKLLQGQGMKAQYATLSYRWGTSSTFLRNTTVSLSRLCENIPWNDLPLLFQEFIHICWALNIDYIWIDTLCILQDSKDDWELESSKMADIYSNSNLTIAATSCKDPSCSLFSDRYVEAIAYPPALIEPCSTFVTHGDHAYQFRPNIVQSHRLVRFENYSEEPERAPLSYRAWVRIFW